MFNRDKVLHLLEKKGWSKYKLAKESNMPQSSLHDILSGKIKNPTGERLKAIASALNVSVDELLDDAKDNYKVIDKLNENIKDSGINTIAAHFEGETFTDDDKKDIENFIRFVLSKKEK